MEPWYRTVIARPEVREGRSFNADEFAIALEQVIERKGAKDYWDPRGVVSSVRITTCSTCSSVIARFAPGRGSS